ncbi:uncharacterized protein [Dermacentor andersoni]|uniref:uncharacterized protein n=1 Tax=Dermacentor andersoni TaxID=34620 RepID=UPI002155830E|nr:uncharacterized protein LOC126541296 [Dermacentor andersoni]
MPPKPIKNAQSVAKPQLLITKPRQSKRTASRAPNAANLDRINSDTADGRKIISSPSKNMPPKYIAQKDFVLSDLSVPFDESVTLTTQATHEFLQHVPVLCSRWQGPVSVAVYAPGTAYAVALDKIAFLRHCDDPCVSANLSWHVVFDKTHEFATRGASSSSQRAASVLAVLAAMFFAFALSVSLKRLKRRRVAVALLFVIGLAAINAVQHYNRRAAALRRLAKLGDPYREPHHLPPTNPAEPQVQRIRRPLVDSPSKVLADDHTRAATRPSCVEERDRRHACWERRRKMRCSYAAESGVDFVVHENFVAGDDCPPAYAENVTLVTHATYGFLRHVAELCDRWQGPLSVAVFAPGTDTGRALAWIDFLRRCGRNACVRRSVTWHLVYDREHTPASLTPGTSHSSYSKNVSGNRPCSSVPAQEGVSSFRRRQRIPYPINVLRNVARRLAPTHYVLVQNVRLYPSTGIVPRFLNLVAEERRLHSLRSDGQEVYVLPVFAMTARAGDPQVQQRPPRSMRELQDALKSRTVVPCNDSSHGGALLWSPFYSAVMNASAEPWNAGPASVKGKRLRVQTTVKRDRGVLLWEPVFLGTRDDPTYGESLTWEGGHERVSQGYAMCLEDYDFHMLEDAFLVQVPKPTGAAGAVVRTGSGYPSLQNAFSLHRFKDSLGSLYPVGRRAIC